MKNCLVVTIFLSLAVSLQAQQITRNQISGVRSVKTLIKKRFQEPEPSAAKTLITPPTAAETEAAKSNAAITAMLISSSMNAFGVLNPNQRPLLWNDNIDAISFIHRQSPTYNAVGANANGKSGTMVAMLSNNMGVTWDSTCIWVNNVNRGRYPQGGLYSAPGNNNWSNAYVVGCGVTTDGGGWTGSWFASKSVTLSPKNAPGPDQQFISNTAPFPPGMGQVDFASYGFSVTDDGLIRTVGGIYGDVNNNAGYRGGQVVKGTFNAGAFVWSSDSLIPPVIQESGGELSLWSEARMAWNEQGTVGYVVFIGSRTGQTGSNSGWQPIVYKSTNSGASWTLLNGIDFNTPAMQIVKNRIAGITTNSNLKIPFFNVGDGYDVSVDGMDNLHIGTTVMSSASQHPDSMSFNSEFGAEQTRWSYTNNSYPYIYDFVHVSNTSNWQVFTVDTMMTEIPGAISGTGGFTVNPFTLDAFGEKVSSGNRLQLSRDVSGARIAFIWADTDTSLTSSKYNIYPDLKVRVLCAPLSVYLNNAVLSNRTEQTKTLANSTINLRIKGKAYFHYASPKMKTTGGLLQIPITVSNNTTLDQDITIDHFFISGETLLPSCIAGGLNSITNTSPFVSTYPNPAHDQVTLTIEKGNANTTAIRILNLQGQLLMKHFVTDAQQSEQLTLPLQLQPGIYILEVKNGEQVFTNKLVIE